jgi:lycopene cyclase domain-containing protein
MPEYLVAAVAAAAAVVIAEFGWLRTGLLRRRQYWIAFAIMAAFQIAVDGWLTKLSAPIVSYSPTAVSGLRGPWDIPVEDFLFAFAMVTATLLGWERARASERTFDE